MPSLDLARPTGAIALRPSVEPHPFHRGQELLGGFFNNWKISTVVNYASGRPVNATVFRDPNQDGDDLNEGLPGYSRNAFTGLDYATTDSVSLAFVVSTNF